MFDSDDSELEDLCKNQIIDRSTEKVAICFINIIFVILMLWGIGLIFGCMNARDYFGTANTIFQQIYEDTRKINRELQFISGLALIVTAFALKCALYLSEIRREARETNYRMMEFLKNLTVEDESKTE